MDSKAKDDSMITGSLDAVAARKFAAASIGQLKSQAAIDFRKVLVLKNKILDILEFNSELALDFINSDWAERVHWLKLLFTIATPAL